MKIEWVNHASFVLESNGVRMISDPWIEGTVFDKGWGLLSEPKFQYQDFESITHIWFSHEHPDHFNPPNIKKIPEEYRKRITVLFQETKDRKVVEYCNKLNFKGVVELNKGKWHEIAADFSVYCHPFEDDSWLCIKAEGKTILNVNDCVLNKRLDAAKIKQIVGNVHLLMTQFSYANWVGNQNDSEAMKSHAKEKLTRIKMQVEVFDPDYVIPFASYVWFCHEENFYMNTESNRVEDVHKFIKSLGVHSIVLYPGDTWQVATDHDSRQALESYKFDYGKVFTAATCIKADPVQLEQLKQNAQGFTKKLHQLNSSLCLRLLKPTKIYLTDHQKSFTLSTQSALTETEVSEDQCDISLSSDALNYAFMHLWGGDTLQINGRFQVPKNGNWGNFRRFFGIASLNNSGGSLTPSFLIKYATQKVVSKIV